MKLLLLWIFPILLSPIAWHNDLELSKKDALSQGKFILLNFSGSDWCGNCIRMHKTYFETDAFHEFADKNLVLLNADFPRLKKNQLPALQQEKNDKMAEMYNAEGSFPFTVLLNAEGKVLQTWQGVPKESPEEFIMAIKHIVYYDHK